MIGTHMKINSNIIHTISSTNTSSTKSNANSLSAISITSIKNTDKSDKTIQKNTPCYYAIPSQQDNPKPHIKKKDKLFLACGSLFLFGSGSFFNVVISSGIFLNPFLAGFLLVGFITLLSIGLTLSLHVVKKMLQLAESKNS